MKKSNSNFVNRKMIISKDLNNKNFYLFKELRAIQKEEINKRILFNFRQSNSKYPLVRNCNNYNSVTRNSSRRDIIRLIETGRIDPSQIHPSKYNYSDNSLSKMNLLAGNTFSSYRALTESNVRSQSRNMITKIAIPPKNIYYYNGRPYFHSDLRSKNRDFLISPLSIGRPLYEKKKRCILKVMKGRVLHILKNKEYENDEYFVPQTQILEKGKNLEIKENEINQYQEKKSNNIGINKFENIVVRNILNFESLTTTKEKGDKDSSFKNELFDRKTNEKEKKLKKILAKKRPLSVLPEKISVPYDKFERKFFLNPKKNIRKRINSDFEELNELCNILNEICKKE